MYIKCHSHGRTTAANTTSKFTVCDAALTATMAYRLLRFVILKASITEILRVHWLIGRVMCNRARCSVLAVLKKQTNSHLL